MMMILIFAAGAYLLGSISFAVLMSRAFGLADPRTYGSGNPGATNVLRSGRKMAAVLTLLGDAAKGWLAVCLAMHFAPDDNALIAVAAVAVFLGHLFPVFLNFKGGKGVATALGVLLALSVWVGLIALATWLVVALVSRYSSLSALIAAAVAPFCVWLFGLPHEWLLAACLVSVLLFWRHKGNIKNLLAGAESRIGGGKSGSQA